MHSLRSKILIIALVFLAFLGAAFFLYSLVTTANYKHLRLADIEKTVALETEKVNKTIAEIELSAITLARDGFMCYKTQSAEIGEISVLEFLKGYPEALGCGFWFEPYAYNEQTVHAGVYAFNDMEEGNIHLDYSFFDDTYDFHSQNWYREILDAVHTSFQVVWTKPYVDDSSYTFMTSAGAGIFNEHGDLLGISNIDWELALMIDELSGIKITPDSFVLLCSPEQDYIILSTYVSKQSPRISPGAGSSLKSLKWDINAGSFLLEGISYLSFNKRMDNGWLLSVQIPENEIIADLERQNRHFSVLIALSSVLILCLVYLLISRLINAPIKQLTSEVAQLALGNLDMQVSEASKDELGLLGRTFNAMTANLKKSIEAYTREHAEKERFQTELTIARRIQAAMLPRVFPPFPDRTEFDIFASMVPAKEVGGDFYDFFLIGENTVALVIADVSGKGVPAALFMAMAKILIKNSARSGKSPGEVLQMVNNTLCENNDASMFTTTFMGYYNTANGKFVYANAGHNKPFLRKSGENYRFLESKPCLVLGGMENTSYREEEADLNPGDAILLYTDGVTEAMNTERVMFSEQLLDDLLKRYREQPPKELLSALKHEIDVFADGAEQSDDITMLAFKINCLAEEPLIELEGDPETPPDMNELAVDAVMENLDKVIDFVNAVLSHCLPEVLGRIYTAVGEIFSNIVKYAYPETGGTVSISITAGNETVIRFEDSGVPFNPLVFPGPDLGKPIAERESGGLGIFLVRELMDEVRYERIDNRNILTITKKN